MRLRLQDPRTLPVHLAAGTILLAGIFFLILQSVAYQWNFAQVWEYREKLLKGWFATLLIAIAALFFSTLFGLITALARRSSIIPVRSTAILYTELTRSTPLLVQILLLYYGVANAVGLQNRMIAGILILSLFAGAYIAEILRAGIESIPEPQLESAQSLGFTSVQTYRFVILPQATRQTLPPLTGQFVSLIKDSSLLSVIGLQEFTLAAREVNSYTFSTLESYLPLAVGYLILTLPLSLLTHRLERRLQHES